MATDRENSARKSSRRKGAQNSEVRGKLIELARTIVQTEGSAAVTAGRIAKEVGLGRHIVHYYFGTIDELLVEVIRSAGEEMREDLERRLATENPVRAIWTPSIPITPLTGELVALAARSEIVRAEVQRLAKLFRAMMARAIESYLDRKGLRSNVPPEAITLTVLSISQALSSETALGVQDGHRETQELVNGWIEAFEKTGQWPTAT